MTHVSQPELDRHLVALASLGDSLRRYLYRCVTSHDGGVSRDEAAASVGISRALAAYHLDKLVEAGLLDTRFERRTGRPPSCTNGPIERLRSPCRPVTTGS